MENKPPHQLHPREEFLLKKKEELEAALKFMKEECKKAKKNGDPNYKIYGVAIDSMLRQFLKIKKELR